MIIRGDNERERGMDLIFSIVATWAFLPFKDFGP